MTIHPRSLFIGFMVMFSSLTFSLTVTAFTDVPGKEMAFYSPIIRVVPDKGFIMISTSSGILWLKASEAAAPHLAKLPVGGRIDVIVVFQGKPNPPIIKSWKLASGGSKCNIFDGTTCVNAEKKQ